MPIRIADALPARATLENENIFVITEHRAVHQDIRPLKLIILNLMPTKIVTETQLMRQLSNTPLQIEVELMNTASYASKNIDEGHLSSFYTTFEQVKNRRYDGMIITGAPVENMEFSEVDYWDELCDIMRWARRNVHSTMHICWGAQAGIYFHYGIKKYRLEKKLYGIFKHHVIDPNKPLFRGFDDKFLAPHSRYTCVRREEIEKCPGLELLAVSDVAGVYACKSEDNREIFVFGHPEYDARTLELEYWRDIEKGLDIDVPFNYFPDDDPKKAPPMTWKSHAQLLYSNWLNYYVYQTTPYDLEEIGKE